MKFFRRTLPTLRSGQSRAERDREATLYLLNEIFGDDITYTHRPSGAPLLYCHSRNHLISVSHSATTIAIAVAEDEKTLGIDVETYRPQLERVKSKFMSEDESAIFTTQLDLLKVWTVKEAVYKAALTQGLPLNEIDCTHMSEGYATALGKRYTLTFPLVTQEETIAIAYIA
ncbi:MAG: 4'-phosphopantetheinyl transferase superfamily protein [Bacteroides sp.]|nr:4'-phosphopantetheinyl transferase superfamily protein [Bacteroides sp.]